MKKELKSGILSADKSADGRPTVGGVNVIAVLPGVEVIKPFSCSNQLSMKFKLLINIKIAQINGIFRVK